MCTGVSACSRLTLTHSHKADRIFLTWGLPGGGSWKLFLRWPVTCSCFSPSSLVCGRSPQPPPGNSSPHNTPAPGCQVTAPPDGGSWHAASWTPGGPAQLTPAAGTLSTGHVAISRGPSAGDVDLLQVEAHLCTPSRQTWAAQHREHPEQVWTASCLQETSWEVSLHVSRKVSVHVCVCPLMIGIKLWTLEVFVTLYNIERSDSVEVGVAQPAHASNELSQSNHQTDSPGPERQLRTVHQSSSLYICLYLYIFIYISHVHLLALATRILKQTPMSATVRWAEKNRFETLNRSELQTDSDKFIQVWNSHWTHGCDVQFSQ